jgi:hypothetical protein
MITFIVEEAISRLAGYARRWRWIGGPKCRTYGKIYPTGEVYNHVTIQLEVDCKLPCVLRTMLFFNLNFIQVCFQLRKLCRVWKDILPDNIHTSALGTLLNISLSKFMADILKLEVNLDEI